MTSAIPPRTPPQAAGGPVHAAVNAALAHRLSTASPHRPLSLYAVHARVGHRDPRVRVHLDYQHIDAAAWRHGPVVLLSALADAVIQVPGFLPAADLYGYALLAHPAIPDRPASGALMAAVGRDGYPHLLGTRPAGIEAVLAALARLTGAVAAPPVRRR